ncbi:uncharacterized protein LOC123007251 [Tribolium madens]|uniref:uncharacterized protein LOC123007251 n=1 Tax=Tribolium madens TaxID=41895 RepID=UPI001CF726CA|nr:uncharacterized protein LOC123007251 [Tribolium madens]XP_044258374.1 uncharacterized protein LOC123007251 [Tribolium madens]
MMEQNVIESNCFSPNSKISELIKIVAQMLKKPTVESDLSQVLKDLLVKVSESDNYLENGIFNINFAEAALLLQSTSDLYSKKVELLWNIIFDYQKRMISHQDNADKEQELAKLEEMKRKYKRKRKTNLVETQTNSLVNNFSCGNVENLDYLNQNYETTDLTKEWEKCNNKQLDNTSHRLTIRKNLFLPNDSVYTEDNDYVGRYDQFHSASLVQDIFDLEKEKLLTDEYNCVTSMRVDTHVINDFLQENSIPSNEPQNSYSKDLNDYINKFTESHNHLTKEQHLQLKESIVCLERLPFSVLKDKLRRVSFADSLFDDDNISSISENCPSPCNSLANHESEESNDLDQMSRTLETRSKSCSQDSAFYEDEDQINESNATLDSTTLTADTGVETTDVISNDNLTNTSTPVPVLSSPKISEFKQESESPVTNNALCLGSSAIITGCRFSKKRFSLDREEKEDKIKRQKMQRISKRLEKKLAKLATGLTVSYRKFEKFLRLQYKLSDNEGIIAQDMSESEESESESDGEPFHGFPESDQETSDTEDISIDPSLPPPLSPIPEPQVPKETPDFLPSTSNDIPIAFDLDQEEISRRNVREWRSSIVPILKNLENKSDFNIHEYGSKIMDPLEVGEQQLFRDIVQGKNATEVTRFFVATLQLANTLNIEITGAKPGKLSNDTFQIKVLNKDRLHEMLEEYQAPSEETFTERLERAKAMNPKVPLHSTPSMEPPAKKRKYTKATRKKLF